MKKTVTITIEVETDTLRSNKTVIKVPDSLVEFKLKPDEELHIVLAEKIKDDLAHHKLICERYF